MKKIITVTLLALITIALSAQRRVDRDTLFFDGKAVGYTITNWYCIEGDKCPDFTVFDENGKKIVSKDLLGKTVVISFWINTCAPCKKELGRVGPELIDKYSPDEFAFIAIGSGETAESARNFRSLSKATFPLCYDESGDVVKKFADNGFPKIFVIDSKGIVRMTEQGYSDEKFSHLKEVVDRLVKTR
jgi:peroxiredoxin